VIDFKRGKGWHRGQGRAAWNTTEPFGAHRAAGLRGWRTPLHHCAQGPDGRGSVDETGNEAADPCRQHAAPAQHPGRHDGCTAVEMLPGKGAQLRRAGPGLGAAAAREGTYAQLRLRSGEIRRVLIGLPRHDRRSRQRREQPAPDRQGRRDALARRCGDGARRGDEPGRSPARWW